MVQITDNPAEVVGKRFVTLTIIRLPADNAKIGARVKMVDPDPNHTASFSVDGRTNGIGDAWVLARRMAKDKKADFILVDDPMKLLPRDKWPQGDNILDDSNVLGDASIVQKPNESVLREANVLDDSNILK